MVNSMTGYGRGTAESGGRELTIELKGVNHRYLDISFRLPRHISFLEDTIRTALQEQLSRGHIDVYANYRNTIKDAKTVKINTDLIEQYLIAGRQTAKQLGVEDDLCLSNLLRLPDAIEIIETPEEADALSKIAKAATLEALKTLSSMRAEEGGKLAQDILSRAAVIEETARKISKKAPIVVEEYRQKLFERVENILESVEVDRQRLATEVALFADRASIDEEIVRLHSHLAQLRKMLASKEPSGRKLDFIVQEINREFNTIGSKANDAEIAELVIAGKSETEKIREQVQNIE